MLRPVNELQDAGRVPITDAGGYYTGTDVEAALQEVGAAGIFTGQLRTLHVGKHGNDSNSGDRIDEAFLTIGAAITAATALTPTQSAPVVIRIHDAGVYQENISIPAWVRVDGPNAEVEGTGGAAAVELTTGSSVVLARIEQANAGLNAITRLDTTGESWAKVGRIDLTSSANGAVNIAIAQPGVLFLQANTINVDTGFGIGDISNSTGHMHVDIGDIYLGGNGSTAIARIGTNSTVGKIDHILESGTPTGTTGISVGNGTMDLFVGTLVADTSWTVALGSTLNLHVTEASGTPSVTGTANVVNALEVETHLNDATIHFTEGSIDHGNLNAASLNDDDHSGHPWLAGRAGGQTLVGGTLATQLLTLQDNAVDANQLTLGPGLNAGVLDGQTGGHDSTWRHIGVGVSRPPTDTHFLIGAQTYTTPGLSVVGVGVFPDYRPSASGANNLIPMQGNGWFATANWPAGSTVRCLDFFPAPQFAAGPPFGSSNLSISGVNTAGLLNILGQTVTANTLTGIAVTPLTNLFGGTDNTTASAVRGMLVASSAATTGTWSQLSGIVVDPQTSGVVNHGLWLHGDGLGACLCFGAGLTVNPDARMYYNGSNLVIDPDVLGSGRVFIGATGDDDMLLNDIEIDGDLNHDGSNLGLFGTAVTTQQTVTGAKGGNVALTNLLTALAAYGLIVDSTT